MRAPLFCPFLLGLAGLALLVPAGSTRAVEPTPAATVRQAVEAYFATIGEIDRQAAERKAQAQAQLAAALEKAGQTTQPSGHRYRGLLGSYFNQDGCLPFILLSVPNGQNVLGEYARSIMNGKYDFTKPLVRFHARGHVVVPQDGQYFLEAGRGYGDFKLNGLGYSLGESVPGNRYGATVALQQGMYEVEISTSNNGGQLPETSIRIVHKKTGDQKTGDQKTEEELPLFFYESELQAFRAELGQHGELAETSKWTEDEQRLK